MQEAVTIYEEIINKTETINTDAFDRQIEQLRVLNDLNDLEKQDRELKLKSEQEALKQKQIVVSIGLLLVLMGLLYMLWRIYMHTKRLRNELLQEKDFDRFGEATAGRDERGGGGEQEKAPLSPISAMRCVRR